MRSDILNPGGMVVNLLDICELRWRKIWNQQCCENSRFKWYITKLSWVCWASISVPPCQPGIWPLRCLWKLNHTTSHELCSWKFPLAFSKTKAALNVSSINISPLALKYKAQVLPGCHQTQAVPSPQKVRNFRSVLARFHSFTQEHVCGKAVHLHANKHIHNYSMCM